MSIRRRRTSSPRAPILAVIPVSGQDPEFRKGLPRLGSRPLLDFTFDAVRRSRLISRAVVSTDDRRIAAAARRAGFDVPYLRPVSDRRKPIAVVLNDLVCHLEENEPGYSPTWVVRLQVTYPFRPLLLIDRAIRTVLSQDLDSAFMAFPEYDTFWNLVNGDMPERITTDVSVPRARRRPIYRELGGLFSMVRRDVLTQGRMYGARLGVLPVSSVVAAVDLHGVHGRDLAGLLVNSTRVRRR